MNAEPVMNQDTLPTEPTHRWADDGGVLTEERQSEPEHVEPEMSMEAESEEPEMSMEMSMEATPTLVVHEPLLSREAEQAFLSRWAEIQVGFVEDPAESVRDADRFVAEIAAALLISVQTRKTDLAADWQQGSPGTEELRQALRRYRAFIGVMLPG
ncbi:hypothetical protein [Catenulispora rubra]|uniref:hypothetical protein n=1 Tax=Catenulispora rubra TaxID=280293 RepID=UPI00189246BE|nr:hypothetical protein [Catenulispora rubra]